MMADLVRSEEEAKVDASPFPLHMCYRWYSKHQPLLHIPVEGVPRGGPGHLPHICGELPRASALKGVSVTP
jgi:hypothetical protein